MKKPPLEFVETAIIIAGEFSASITAGGFDWISAIFEAYEREGSPADLDEWIRERFADEFRCVGPRPNWIYDGSSWPFMAGRPMVFVGQLAGKDDDAATDDAEYFLFAGLQVTEDGPRRETKVLTQYRSQQWIHESAEHGEGGNASPATS